MQPLLKSTIPRKTRMSRVTPGRYTKWILGFLGSLIDRDVMARVVTEVDLARPRNFLLRVEEHLFPLRDPAGSARNREEDREHRHRETHRLINQAGIEVHVGIELALDEVIVFEGDAFTFESDFQERVLAHEFEDFISNVFDDAGAGIVVLVDAMAEAHEFDFTGFNALDELRDFLNGADLHEHAENFFIGAAMERTIESGDGGSGCRIRIDVRAADASNGIGGAILLVVGVQDEEHIESALESRVRPVFRF